MEVTVMKAYNILSLVLLTLGTCATASAMQEPVKKEDIRFIGGVPITQTSMSAQIKKLSQLQTPTQKTKPSSWLNPVSKLDSYISSSFHTYQKNRAQRVLNYQFAQAVEKHIIAIKDQNIPNTQSTLGTVKNLLAQGANPETLVVVPYDIPFYAYDPFAANRDWFRAYSPPLYLAIYAKGLDLVKLLVQNKADIDKGVGNSTPLKEAVYINFDAAAHVLLNNHASIRKAELSFFPWGGLILFSASHQNLPLTIELLQRGARVTTEGHGPETNQFLEQAFELQKVNANKEYKKYLAAEDAQYRQQLKHSLHAAEKDSPALPTVICDTILSYVPENTHRNRFGPLLKKNYSRNIGQL
jgi:hypothetical protein